MSTLTTLVGVQVDASDDEGFYISFVPEVGAEVWVNDSFVSSVFSGVSFVYDGISSNIASSAWPGGY